MVLMAGGPQLWVNSAVQGCCQGHAMGRCRTIRRADEAIRAGTVMRVRRMVPVVALASPVPAMVAAARVRLKRS